MKLPSGRLDFLKLQDAIASGTRVTIVTPNRRLAARMAREFNDAHRDAGRLTWESADILPLDTFLERTYRYLSLRAHGNALPLLLSAFQCLCIWEDLVRKTESRDGLLSVPQAAKQAFAAWQMANAWQLLPALRRFPLHEDARIFLKWVNQYQRLCGEQGLVDLATLPEKLAEFMADGSARAVLPSHLFAVGFDIVTPQRKMFFDACVSAGVDCQSAATGFADVGNANVSLTRVEFLSEAEELQSCAAWARQRLESDPSARIAIVVPDLRAKRRQVARLLTDVLLPAERARVRSHDAEAPQLFNISLGQPLGDYPPVCDAMSLIEFSQRRSMSTLAVSALLRSPYIAGAEGENASRAILDKALRDMVSPDISLLTLQKTLSAAASAGGGLAQVLPHCMKLRGCIDRAVNIGSTPDRARGGTRQMLSPEVWGKHFANVLGAWEFPGNAGLDSAEYQVLEKFRDVLESLSSLASVKPRMNAEEAIAQLRRILNDTIFQPESPALAAKSIGTEPPIQVLGVLESAGQRFDALWVTGLTDEAWPLPVRPAAFIPAALQRSAGVTEASAVESLALDQRITEGWRACAAEVIFSHAQQVAGRNSDDQLREPSALIRSIPRTPITDVPGCIPLPRYADLLKKAGVREAIPDRALVSLPILTAIHGGTSVIRDQAACPFRAFARHRMLAQALSVPHVGLDAAERGTLLHRALSLAWKRIVSHAGLVALDENGILEVVRDSAAQAIAETHTAGTECLRGRFAEIEQVRLVRLIEEWLAYERGRAPFEVVERERKRPVSFSGLSINVRLDRLDRLADGTHALIDYKTGVAKWSSWLGSRPEEPQLPLYCITAEQPVSALAFARLKRMDGGKSFGFEGVSAVENLLPDVTPVEQKKGMEKRGYVSWDVLVREWEESLTALAQGFVAGDARVDPKNGALTCAQCDLQSVCRIAENAGYAEFDSMDAVGSNDEPGSSGVDSDE